MEREPKQTRFRGRAYRAMDAKGRLMLPPEYRELLAPENRLVLTTYDDCIVGFSLSQWEIFEDSFSKLNTLSRKVRDFKRLVVGGAEEIAFDMQGRIRISAAHIAYAGLSKEIVIVGQGHKFELWDSAHFTALMNQDFSDVAEELSLANASLAL